MHIIREVAGEFERPVILFSGGKDSVGVAAPGAARRSRRRRCRSRCCTWTPGTTSPRCSPSATAWSPSWRLRLHVAAVQDWIDDGRLTERPDGTRNPLQTVPLLDTINEHRFDAVFGGARRDEDQARAKERIFSCATPSAAGIRAGSVPSCGTSTTAGTPPVSTSGSSRCPTGPSWTSGTTSRARGASSCPDIYYAHEREVFTRGGMWLTAGEWGGPRNGERIVTKSVRYRTVGDMLLHRRGGVDGRDDRRGPRRDRRQPDHRARRHPGRRPAVRGRHGRPQARRATSDDGAGRCEPADGP